MIDREARNRLLQGIDDYMDEKISAAEFNTLLHQKITPNTKDELIEEVSFWLFDSNEDVGTNRLQSVCPYWKYFNRIRLLLASDAEYQYVQTKQRPSLVQWIGGVSAALFLVLAVASLLTQPWSWDFFLTFGIPLYFTCGIVVGCTIFGLGFFPTSQEPERKILFAEYPFESFADLLAVRRSVPQFLSKRFPNKPPIPAPSQNRLIRFLWDTKCPAWVDRVGDAFILFCCCVVAIFSVVAGWPLVILLFFLLRNSRQTRFVLPGHGATK